MADAIHLSVMGKQIEDNKQATDDIRAQMADLMKHQADLSKSIEAMLSKLVSLSSGQTSRASGLNASLSGCLTNSTTTPLLPDPPDTIRYGKELVGNGEAEAGIPKGLSTRLTMVGFPPFDGTKLRNWVYRCEQFFMLDGTPPEMKVRLASVYLDGEAFEWHRNYINSRYGVYPLWPGYVADLTGRFGEDIDDPLSVLVKVKQDGDSVEKYLARFESALTMVSLPATHSLSIFMANMNPRLALHVRQFAARTVSEAARFAKLHESYLHFSPSKQDRAPFSPYQNQNNQFHYNSPNTTSSLPPLETTKTLPYKPNIPTETDMEKSPKKLYCEEIQENGMRGLCMSSDGSYVSGHHLGSKKSQVFVVECDDEESFGVREPSEVIVEEIVDKSVDMIQEEKSTPENESRPEVSPQILLSQFQVPIPSLEPSRRCQKESLAIVNDLSCDLGCVIGKTIGSICDSELGQDNSYDEEEFLGVNLGKLLKNERLFSTICLLGLNDMSCWTQLWRQQIFPKSWRFKFKTASRESKLLDNNFSGIIKLIKQSSSGDNQFIRTQLSSLVKAYEMPYLGRDKWTWSEKQRMYNKAWKFKYVQRFMSSVLPQNGQHKLLQGRNIKCKMKKMEVLRRLKQFIFTEVQFHMENNSERMLLELVNLRANTRDAELETTLTDRDTFQKLLEDFYRARAYDYMALRVLELIKDKASRKRKLYKNWWFKYKFNTWLSEALHFWRKRTYEKLQILGRATHGLLLKQSFSQVLLHIQNRDYSFLGYMLVATSLVETENIYSFSVEGTHMEGEIMGFKLLLTSGLNWKKFIEWVKIYFSEKQYQENTRLMRSATTKLIRSDFCHLFVQKIHVIWALHNFEKTVAATKVNQNSETSQDCYLLLFLERVKASFEIKFTMEQSEKPLITILSYEWFHSPRPPELSCCKEDEESTAKISSLRTRMI